MTSMHIPCLRCTQASIGILPIAYDDPHSVLHDQEAARSKGTPRRRTALTDQRSSSDGRAGSIERTPFARIDWVRRSDGRSIRGREHYHAWQHQAEAEGNLFPVELSPDPNLRRGGEDEKGKRKRELKISIGVASSRKKETRGRRNTQAR